MGRGSEVVLGNWVSRQTGSDVGMESLGIHDDARVKCRNVGGSSLERRGELLLSKDRTTVLWIYRTIGVISLFKVDVPLSSQSVGFSTEFTGSKPNDQIKLC